MDKSSKSAKIHNDMAANAILVILGILFAILLTEIGVRILCVVLNRPPIVTSDSYAGWAGRANLNNVTKSYSNGRFYISTDKYGRRITYPKGTTASASAPTILIAGDSFVQGIGVQDQETFAWHFTAVPLTFTAMPSD